jgi:hypothetical protein
MRQYRWFAAAVAVAAIGGLALAAGETVPVRESEVRYPVQDEVKIGYNTVRLKLTGTALRKSRGLSLYTIGSYVEEHANVRTAEQLIAADNVKMMHVVLERPIDGPIMFEGIRNGIRLNHAADAFPAELGQLERTMKGLTMPKGQHVRLIYLPKVGVRCEAVGKAEATINSLPFAKAIWEIYLGPHSRGEQINFGLTSRL